MRISSLADLFLMSFAYKGGQAISRTFSFSLVVCYSKSNNENCSEGNNCNLTPT